MATDNVGQIHAFAYADYLTKKSEEIEESASFPQEFAKVSENGVHKASEEVEETPVSFPKEFIKTPEETSAAFPTEFNKTPEETPAPLAKEFINTSKEMSAAFPTGFIKTPEETSAAFPTEFIKTSEGTPAPLPNEFINTPKEMSAAFPTEFIKTSEETSAAFPKEFIKTPEMLENNPVEKVNGTSEDTFKRKIEKEVATNGHRAEEEPVQKKKMIEHKCKECDFKCYNEAELKTHQTTSHGQKRRQKVCDNCGFSCENVWEMDFHCRSRGHKVKKDESIPCKKCDYMAENKEDSWNHKKVHIPADKLFECADCYWVGDRLDNIRYHVHSQEHNMKNDYEAIALAKAEAKGAKDVAHYHKKLAKDIKMAKKGNKS